ncbi:MAG: 1-acyl-sn-glycerol-3-phosphate acyltransferase [Thermoanaerobaculia bacterium]
MRPILAAILRLIVRLFFRRIEIAGEEKIPDGAGVIFAMNHPNGLVDPLLLLCFAPRPVSFLAKAPLFRYPLINIFVRGLDSIPVYRRTDAVAGTNEETFARAREVLGRGGAVAIFPEGTTHSDARLKELKTGAARIALGAAAKTVAVVPAGIYYTQKQTFRSGALIIFGTPIIVQPQAVDEPAHDAVDALTAEIERGLSEVTLQADSVGVLDLIARAERIFSGGETGDLAYQLDLRRRFVAGYRYLCERDPGRIEEFASRIERFESELRDAGLELDALMTGRGVVLRSVAAILLLPLAIAGLVIHYPAYWAVGFLARRFARDEHEMQATYKLVASLILYPLTWIGCFFIAWWLPIVAPFLGYIALRVFESLDVMIERGKARVRRDTAQRLIAERTEIRAEIAAIAEEINASALSRDSGRGR